MKKYAASFIIFVLAIGTLITFFIYEHHAVSAFPSFYIQQTAGDKREIKQFILDGNYYDGQINENLQITTNGTSYYRDRSFFEKLSAVSDPGMKRLQNEYHSFMRGKAENMNQYYENQDKLIYANIDAYDMRLPEQRMQSKLEIAIWDKQKKQKSSFKATIPHIDRYIWMDIQSLKFNNGKLYVATNNERYSDSGQNSMEAHLFQVDLKSGKLGDDKTLLKENADDQVYSKDNGKNGETYTSINFVPQENAQENNMIVLQKTISEIGNEAKQDKVLKNELISYEIGSAMRKKLSLPAELPKSAEPVSQNGTSVYFKVQSANKLTVYSYDVHTEKVTAVHQFPLQAANREALIEVKNNRIYIISPAMRAKRKATVFVADAKTAKTLYKGVIKVKGDQNLIGEQSLEVDSLEIGNGETK
ncbi:hypothetical protein ACFSMW_12655 [Virgibacillus halophilus]|uniref:hypothetical protein n=1 Tax=Tigheibacillus halophilus TaxID=361280 RepID=UPI0036420102